MITEAAPSAQPVPEELAPRRQQRNQHLLPKNLAVRGSLAASISGEQPESSRLRHPCLDVWCQARQLRPRLFKQALRPARDGEAVKPQGAEGRNQGGPPQEARRQETRCLGVSEKELRSGRIPRKKRAASRQGARKTEITVPRASKRVIKISEVITVGDLARDMGVKAGESKLMGLGMMATINQVLDADTALIASEFDHQVENVAFDADSALEVEHQVEEQETALMPRSPVVTIMGHVDHGKTSLLDAYCSTNVTAQEHGGITSISTCSMQVDGRSVTFLDTPGHEAFTAMRARGAQVTDIVVLVVAADDGVMPQTVEKRDHAALQKCPSSSRLTRSTSPANLERVKKGLSEYGLVSEDWEDDTVLAPVSAKTQRAFPISSKCSCCKRTSSSLQPIQTNSPAALLLKQSSIEDADRWRPCIVKGNLHVGDAFVCGVFYGKVRAMVDDQGRKVDAAPPSFPVEILGLQGVPQAGDSFVAVTDEAKRRVEVAEYRHSKQRETELVPVEQGFTRGTLRSNQNGR